MVLLYYVGPEDLPPVRVKVGLVAGGPLLASQNLSTARLPSWFMPLHPGLRTFPQASVKHRLYARLML